jgi:hypothetical protein
MDGGTGDNKIVVAVRVRPPSRQESACQACARCEHNTLVMQRNATDELKQFSFDHLYSPLATNDDLFADLGTEVLRNAWLGVR